MITAIPLGRRLTALIEQGQHPATGKPILPDRTCGTCALRKAQAGPGHNSQTGRTKCRQAAFPRGGPNLPTQTPACTLYQPADREADMQTPDTTAAPASIPPPRAGTAPKCCWSDCRATEALRLYACGVRCPAHTPSALAGTLEPEELLARSNAKRELERIERERTAAVAALDGFTDREKSAAAAAAAPTGTKTAT